MDVCAWVERRRKEDPSIGWRTLVEELRVLTGRRVAFRSLSNWCRQLDDDEAQ